MPPVNPYLAPDTGKSSIHFDAANSDSTPHAAWLGTSTVEPKQVRFLPGNLVNVGYAFRRYPDGTETLIYSGPTSDGKVRTDGGRFDLVSVLVVPGAEAEYIEPEQMTKALAAIDAAGSDEGKMLIPFKELLVKAGGSAGGMYTLLDRDGFYYAPYGTKLFKIADEKANDVTSAQKLVASIDVLDKLPADYRKQVSAILGTNMTYDGYIALAMPGLIAVTDRDFKQFWYAAIPGESVENGIAVDDKGGIYVVTSKQMRKVVWTGERLSLDVADGAWAAPYDIGPHDSRSLSNGSGATPTLMGFGSNEDKLVVIPDAAKPVKVVAFWRDQIPADAKPVPGALSPRIADQIALTIPAIGTVEWSMHVYGYGTMAMNSTFPDPVRPDEKADPRDKSWLWATLLTMADTREGPRGAEKFEWNPTTNKLERRWRNNAQLQWGLHPVSIATNTVHLAAHENGAFKLIGLDWTTGEQVAEVTLGSSRMFNVAGGFIQPLPDGDLYVSGYFGPVLIGKPETH